MPCIDSSMESDINGVIFGKENCQRIYKEIMGIPLSGKYISFFFKEFSDGEFRAKIDLIKLKKKFSELYIFQGLKKLKSMKNNDRKKYFKDKILPLVRDAVSESQFTRKIDPDKNHVESAKARFANGRKQSYC